MPILTLIFKSQRGLGSEGLFTLLKLALIHRMGAFMGGGISTSKAHFKLKRRPMGGTEVPNLNLILKNPRGLGSEGLFTLVKPTLTHRMGAFMVGEITT